MNGFPSRCYYCTIRDFISLNEYECHIVTRHPNLPGFPNSADIEFYGLEKQDMPWEREMKSDIEWK